MKAEASKSSLSLLTDDVNDNKKEFTKSIVDASVKENVEEEKCVVAQYRTSTAQKDAFVAHLATCERTDIPVEWVIDIADESNGWFYGTAYHFDDSTQMLHVMVPDKLNPSFDGKVMLDHRTVHLIECVDGKTDALFNKIVRDSVIKIKWDVEWYEEEQTETGAATASSETSPIGTTPGKWITSIARYYIRIANQLLVEDKDFGQESRGFVILSADINLRLMNCNKNKGSDDFYRLINEAIVQSSPEAQESAKNFTRSPSLDEDMWGGGGSGGPGSAESRRGGAQKSHSNDPNDGPVHPPVRKLADMARGLKECLADILEDREDTKRMQARHAKLFTAFTLDGDLDKGLKLMDQMEEIRSRGTNNQDRKAAEEEEKMEGVVDDAWYLTQKLDKNLTKLLRSTTGGGSLEGPLTSAEEELEYMRKSMKKMKKDLEEKEAELQALKASR